MNLREYYLPKDRKKIEKFFKGPVQFQQTMIFF